MSWTKVDGDAHCELAHVCFASAKAVGESFSEMARADDPTSWRDAIFELIAYVAMGELDSGVAIELIGSALAECGYSSQSVEAIVDAIWSHDVQIGSLKIESSRRYLAALVQKLESAAVVP
jgi:hypothetical protein